MEFTILSGCSTIEEAGKDIMTSLPKLALQPIKTAQSGWPLGMPLIRKIQKDLREVRTTLNSGIARVFFTVDGEYMILLHGFIKKSQKTPEHELKTALVRLGHYRRG